MEIGSIVFYDPGHYDLRVKGIINKPRPAIVIAITGDITTVIPCTSSPNRYKSISCIPVADLHRSYQMGFDRILEGHMLLNQITTISSDHSISSIYSTLDQQDIQFVRNKLAIFLGIQDTTTTIVESHNPIEQQLHKMIELLSTISESNTSCFGKMIELLSAMNKPNTDTMVIADDPVQHDDIIPTAVVKYNNHSLKIRYSLILHSRPAILSIVSENFTVTDKLQYIMEISHFKCSQERSWLKYCRCIFARIYVECDYSFSFNDLNRNDIHIIFHYMKKSKRYEPIMSQIINAEKIIEDMESKWEIF